MIEYFIDAEAGDVSNFLIGQQLEITRAHFTIIPEEKTSGVVTISALETRSPMKRIVREVELLGRTTFSLPIDPGTAMRVFDQIEITSPGNCRFRLKISLS